MSQGGRGVLQYTQEYPRRFTAVAPAPGGTVEADASCYFQDTGLWVFHGENDAEGILGAGVFNPCNMVNVAYQYDNPGLYVLSPQCQSIVGQPRPPGRLTMFDDVAHFAWVQTVDPINSGFPASEWPVDQGCNIPATFRQYSAALDSDGVYSWFLSLDRPGVVAPDDVTIDVPMVSLPATITDDDAVTITWTQTAGPAAVLAAADTATLEVSGLDPMTEYAFEIYVVDSDGQWNLDDVIVTTEMFEPVGGSSSSGGEPGSSSGDPGGSSGDPGGSSGNPGSSSGDPGSSSDDGPTPGSSSGGSSSEGDGDGTQGSSSGPGDTGMGVSASSDSGDGPVADDTQGGSTADPTGGNATSADPDASASGPDSAGGSSSGGRETDDAGAVTDDTGGCGCRSDVPSSGATWAWALVVLAARRRRGSRR
jgi:hypothetical protein